MGTTIAIPGLGLVIAGPLAAAMAGAGAGAATGGIVGALIGWGIPEERVKEYDEGIREGGILMAVHPRNDEDATYLEDSWKANRAARLPISVRPALVDLSLDQRLQRPALGRGLGRSHAQGRRYPRVAGLHQLTRHHVGHRARLPRRPALGAGRPARDRAAGADLTPDASVAGDA